jgi:ATP-dependent RNA helicase DeaD
MTQETGGFASLGLHPTIVAAVVATGYEEPSAIQQQSIPIILAGHDMIGQAQTGTGKTAAFALPILSRIDPSKREPQALILAPTRELALQVATAFETYAKQMPGVTVVAVYGGAPMGPQLKAIRNGAQIVVATPGRLCDHLRRDEKVLATVNHLVLDEADEMLKLGFMDDLEVIFKAMPETRQTVLFSATLPQSIRAIAERHLKEPHHVKIQTKTQTVTAIEQAHLLVHADQKTSAVLRLLEVEEFDALIAFVRTKQATLDLASALEAKGYKAAALNGDIAQNQRERVIESLKDGRLDIVVATDVAARGLDVPRITHVFNVDMPYDPESYVHRIGRTGRAGREGRALLLVTPRERRMLQVIERVTGQKVAEVRLPDGQAVLDARIRKLTNSLAPLVADVGSQAIEQITVLQPACPGRGPAAQGHQWPGVDPGRRASRAATGSNQRAARAQHFGSSGAW